MLISSDLTTVSAAPKWLNRATRASTAATVEKLVANLPIAAADLRAARERQAPNAAARTTDAIASTYGRVPLQEAF